MNLNAWLSSLYILMSKMDWNACEKTGHIDGCLSLAVMPAVNNTRTLPRGMSLQVPVVSSTVFTQQGARQHDKPVAFSKLAVMVMVFQEMLRKHLLHTIVGSSSRSQEAAEFAFLSFSALKSISFHCFPCAHFVPVLFPTWGHFTPCFLSMALIFLSYPYKLYNMCLTRSPYVVHNTPQRHLVKQMARGNNNKLANGSY